MNRRPNLIAPVLIVACALIVMGGIATGLAETGDPAGATVALPIALQENETTIPTTATVTNTMGTVIETTVTATETATVANTTVPSPTAPGGADWPLPNGDMANTRAGTLDGASGSTVTGLAERWSTAIETGSMANPIIVGDLVFVQDSSGTTYAFDRTTGAERWRQSNLTGGNRTTGPTVSPTETPTGNVTVEPTAGAENRTLLDVATSESDLTTLVTALTEANLTGPLNGTGMYTVFAPENAAFDALAPGTLDSLRADEAVFADVLKYHVVAGTYTSQNLLNTTTLVTLEGEPLNVTRGPDGAIMVDGATVVRADLRAMNGVLHVIDTVLIPPNVNATVTATPIAVETTTTTMTATGTTTLESTPTAETPIPTESAALQQLRKVPVLGQEENETTGPTTIATTGEEANETPTVAPTATSTATPNATETATVTATGTPNATETATVSPTESPSGAASFEGPHGPVAGDGRVYVPVPPASLAALDQATGNPLWTTQLTADARMVIAMQPSFANGLVYVSTSPGPDLDEPEGGGIGTFYAVDAATGQVRWEFPTVDSADVWGNPSVNSGGGAEYSPAVDGNGTMYWSTAGPNPAPGTRAFPNAGSRPGPNLWTNGIGAVDAATGAPGWFTQAIPADIYNQDFFIPPVLATATVQNQARDLVIGAGEDGRVIAFDRETGGIVWTASVGRHENDRLERIPDAGITVWPGALGGVHSPMACADGYVYVASVELPTSYMPWGITSSLDPVGARGMISAINLSTGRTAWQKPLDSAPTGGATVADGLVLTGTYDGRVMVLDATTGDERAARFLAGPITSTPALSGGMVIWQAGTGGNARVFALSFEGAVATVTQTATATETPTGTGTTAEPTVTIEPNPTATIEPTPTANETTIETPTVTATATETNSSITGAEIRASTFVPAVSKAPPTARRG